MCSSGSILPINLVNVESFIPTGVAALLISGEKGPGLAKSMLVPFAFVRQLFRRGYLFASVTWQLSPSQDHFPPHLVSEPPNEWDASLRGRRSSSPAECEYKFPPSLPGWMTIWYGFLPSTEGGVPSALP
ncbi:hypothetical protein LIER_40561 [Lithospermum erythrorhizon]|uniref:Uncharacterized protein n=1 Tax=Lithospermum erythrorhizon TaxID=34254 RepID=A0AAV3QXN7_LITER